MALDDVSHYFLVFLFCPFTHIDIRDYMTLKRRTPAMMHVLIEVLLMGVIVLAIWGQFIYVLCGLVVG